MAENPISERVEVELRPYRVISSWLIVLLSARFFAQEKDNEEVRTELLSAAAVTHFQLESLTAA
jgi:hypothetical protein